MAQGSNQENASIAWFKLAELITRREREKALSIYRLLAHSLECKAYALQLEADILWSFDDKSASEKYRQAAFLYHKEKQWVDASGIYEHLYSMNGHDVEALTHLIRYYALLQYSERFLLRVRSLHELIEKKVAYEHHLISAVKQTLDEVQPSEEATFRLWMKTQLQNEMQLFSQELSQQLSLLLG